MFNFADYFAERRSRGTPATGINVDPAPKGITESQAKINALTEKLIEQDSQLNAYREALAHQATEKIQRELEAKELAEVEQRALSNWNYEEDAALTNATQQLFEQRAMEMLPAEMAARQSARDVAAFTDDPLNALIREQELLNTYNPLVFGGNDNIKYLNQLVRETIRGKYGNGAERRKALGASYDAVQKEINKLYRR